MPNPGWKMSKSRLTRRPRLQHPMSRCTCPLPKKMSPTLRSRIRAANAFLSSNFAEIYKQLGTNPALSGTHLLSVSFDPEHDSPEVLRDYGFSVAHTRESALFRRWEFAA